MVVHGLHGSAPAWTRLSRPWLVALLAGLLVRSVLQLTCSTCRRWNTSARGAASLCASSRDASSADDGGAHAHHAASCSCACRAGSEAQPQASQAGCSPYCEDSQRTAWAQLAAGHGWLHAACRPRSHSSLRAWQQAGHSRAPNHSGSHPGPICMATRHQLLLRAPLSPPRTHPAALTRSVRYASSTAAQAKPAAASSSSSSDGTYTGTGTSGGGSRGPAAAAASTSTTAHLTDMRHPASWYVLLLPCCMCTDCPPGAPCFPACRPQG